MKARSKHVVQPNEHDAMKKAGLLVSLLVCLAPSTFLNAGQDRDTNPAGVINGFNVSINLRHRVTIPSILYFRVGSAAFNTVDKVRFDVVPPGSGAGNNNSYLGSAAPPIGDGTPIAATVNGVLPVALRSNIGAVEISYTVNNAAGLSNGSGQFIGFDEISLQSSDPGFPAPVLANSGGAAGSANAVTVNGNNFSGRVIVRDALWTMSYLNNQVALAGTYNGSVSFTAASP